MIVKSGKNDIQEYVVDAANYTGDAKEVLIPETMEELHRIFIDKYEENIPITFSAARTSLTGSAIPHEGVIISLERLDKIIEIDEKNMTCTVQPGIRLEILQKLLSEKGLLYTSNPTETWSMIGGNVATNASGAKTFKYGPTRDYVKEMDIYLTNGSKVHLERHKDVVTDSKFNLNTENGNYLFDYFEPNYPNSSKNASGYYLKNNMDMLDLFIGSEGTLGLIGNIKLKIKKKPDNVLSTIVFFKSKDKMLGFVDNLRDTKNNNNPDELSVRLIEYFDGNSLKLLSEFESNLPSGANYAIWTEQEADNQYKDILLDKLYELISEYTDMPEETWLATNAAELRKITEFRHKLPLSVNEFLSKYDQQKIYTDTAVPVEVFKDYYDLMYKELESLDLDYVVFGHIGDCHLHANLFMKNNEDRRKANEFYHKMVDKALDYNGTFSAEHGVGKIKREFISRMYSSKEIDQMKKIKNIFDPKNLLGLGNIFIDRE